MMDVSSNYIKMCDCPEIHEKWKPQTTDFVKGDFVGFLHEWGEYSGINGLKYGQGSVQRFQYDNETFGKYAWYYKDELIWLPRQDQLQDIVNDKYSIFELMTVVPLSIVDITVKAYAESNLTIGELFKGKSMEQLWLTFVMRECYNKEWQPKEKLWKQI